MDRFPNHDPFENIGKKRTLGMRSLKFFMLLTFIGVGLLVAARPLPTASFADTLSDNDSMLVTVGIERIRTHLTMVETSHAARNTTMAFGHAYVIHASVFPSIDPILQAIDEESYRILEARLANLAFHIKARHITPEGVHEEKAKIENVMDRFSSKIDPKFSSDKSVISHQAVILLNDSANYYQEYKYYDGLFPNCTYQQAFQQYQLTNAEASQLNYESAIGFLDSARMTYAKISDSVEERRDNEIKSFFAELKNVIKRSEPGSRVEAYVSAIQRDLLEEIQTSTGSRAGSDQAAYFKNIREMLNGVLVEVAAGNYQQADQYAITAYLENYEYLEAPLEKHDPELMAEIELLMREELRDLIGDEASEAEVRMLVSDILRKLDRAENTLKSFPEYYQAPALISNGTFSNIEGLSQGFGMYRGPTKQIGEADESAKTSVRSDVDSIRQSLDGVIRLYGDGNKEDAFILAQSAYLDSYEKIEIPLRPIDPDFTLEMEIRFAELRDLIQSGAAFETVEAKVIELRRGLDESERLVHGTGTAAPGIALSTSFSIIFREGLEGAIIIGTIITYLESSRNQRFKKHVYYGILMAIGASMLTWFVVEYVASVAGISTTIIKAVASLSAVAVLFWVSFWILNNIETKRWMEFIQAKVWKATTAGSGTVFVLLAFFTIYREGFGTALFFQAMFSFAKYMESYVVIGLVAGLATVIGIAFLIRKIGKRVPLRVLFYVTIGIGAYMSITFIGNAVREFQVAGYLPTTSLIGTVPRFDISLATMTGVHPTFETIAVQLVLITVYFVGSVYLLLIKPKRQALAKLSRKSIGETDRQSQP